MYGLERLVKLLTVSMKLLNEAWRSGAGATWRRLTMTFISSESPFSFIFDYRCSKTYALSSLSCELGQAGAS